MTLTERVTSLYQQGASIRTIAPVVGASRQTVRRILITEGLWGSSLSDRINDLRDDGHSVAEIADMLHVSVSAVGSYLRYPKGPRADWPDTINAQRIRACRERQKKSEKRGPST